MKKKNILVIITGGTFASVEIEDGVRVLGDIVKFCDTLKCVETGLDSNVEMDIVSPLYMFSENITFEDWQVILSCIRDNLKIKKYDGVLITHGSDTLAYTANMIAISTQGCNIPIILIASSQPLGYSGCNGLVNFKAALNFVVGTQYKGTYVAYSYDNVDTIIYVGERVLQSQMFVDRYSSFGSNLDFGIIQLDGTFVIGDIELCKTKLQQVDDKPLIDRLPNLYDLNSNILMISPHVGMDFGVFDLKGVDTVIVNPYHSSTYCWLEIKDDKIEQNKSMQILHDKCMKLNIPLIVAPYRDNATKYSNIKNKILRLPNISSEATLVKVLWANSLYNKDSIEWNNFLYTPIACEFLIY
ncbi:MAG: asparaginase domain-containing protein [Firmicutes bacterium]|nr:asparaginase domain-containing protein [Bacillota bacterium]MCL1954044.1 asparaginase domain-containing protein [Bacillota bacterium]